MWLELEFNFDFLANIAQSVLNFAILVGLCVYILCTYSWDSNT